MPSGVTSAVALAVVFFLLYVLLRFTTLGRGFSVPLKVIFTKPITSQYPEVLREPAPRFHGRHQLNRYDDGLEKCIGCELCAWACPADAIFVQGDDNTAEQRFSPGERYASDYQINYNRCIFCGLCIEACPTRALTMTQEFELSEGSRDALIYRKTQLLAPVPEGAEPPPHTQAEVEARGFNYYGGDAVTPPLTSSDAAQSAVNRPYSRASTVVPDGEWVGERSEIEDKAREPSPGEKWS